MKVVANFGRPRYGGTGMKGPEIMEKNKGYLTPGFHD